MDHSEVLMDLARDFLSSLTALTTTSSWSSASILHLISFRISFCSSATCNPSKALMANKLLWMTLPFLLFPSIPPLCYPIFDPSTSTLSPLSPTSSDLLYDSFYESFLFLAYDSFRLIAWVTPIFRYDSLWLILWVILIFRPSDFRWLIPWVISILSSWLIRYGLWLTCRYY